MKPYAWQDDFNNNTLDYLILPLVAQQLKTAVKDLDTVNRKKGLVRHHITGALLTTKLHLKSNAQ